MASIVRGRCLLQRYLGMTGLSQTELANRTGYSQRMISHFANDTRRMSIEAMYVITLELRRYIPSLRMEDLYEWE